VKQGDNPVFEKQKFLLAIAGGLQFKQLGVAAAGRD
jgi:hypothetical protein